MLQQPGKLIPMVSIFDKTFRGSDDAGGSSGGRRARSFGDGLARARGLP